MIQNETVMTVADNSGARKAMCIKVLGGSHRRYATVGDKIVVAIKEAIPRGKVQKGTVQRAIIVRTKFPIKRADLKGNYHYVHVVRRTRGTETS